MKAVQRRDTKPEKVLRSELHARGLRFRIDAPPEPGLRGRADVVFPRARIAIYVDGCFWHSCPEHATIPKAIREWWEAKLAANVERDKRVTRDLTVRGWHALRIWEHSNMLTTAAQIAELYLLRTNFCD
jgi:DNA mismatch endonuclease, patch repair protein